MKKIIVSFIMLGFVATMPLAVSAKESDGATRFQQYKQQIPKKQMSPLYYMQPIEMYNTGIGYGMPYYGNYGYGYNNYNYGNYANYANYGYNYMPGGMYPYAYANSSVIYDYGAPFRQMYKNRQERLPVEENTLTLPEEKCSCPCKNDK